MKIIAMKVVRKAAIMMNTVTLALRQWRKRNLHKVLQKL